MKNLKLLFLSSISLLFCGVLSAQQLDKAQADREAQLLLNKYQADLELTIEQVTDFHHTISTYLMKRSEIENKALAPEAQKSALTQLSSEETSKMTSILNKNQLKLYKKLKPKIQPL
ncbi:MAG: hypothetical protein ACR2MM_08250 [Flavobacteriaceae bacterium]